MRVNELRDEMWPGTPIVFCCTNKGILVSHPSSRTTGVSVDLDWRGNLRLARQLFPATQHVVLVGGATEEDHRLNDPLSQVIRQDDPAMELIDLTNLPLSEQLARVKVLPPNTVIMFGLLLGDVTGNISTPIPGGFQAKLAREADVPIFFTLNTPGPTGGLGGYMAETVELGKEVGALGLSVLSGKTQPDAPPSPSRAIHLHLDWGQIRRWKIPASRIPKDAVIDFAPPSLWESHKDAVIIAAIALAAQSLLIVFLMLEQRRRRASQKLLAERLRFETLLAQVSAGFAHVTNETMEPAIYECLRAVQGFFESSMAGIWEPRESGHIFQRTHVWPGDTGAGSQDKLSTNEFSATMRQLSLGEIVSCSSDAERTKLEDGESFRRLGIRSFLAIPLRDEDRVIGFLQLASRDREMFWAPDIVRRLRVISEILGGVLARRNASRALQESELLKFSLLESMRSSVAVIDQSGSVLEVNQHWLSSTSGGTPLQSSIGAGSNYLEVCLEAPNGLEVVAGLQSVLDGSRQIFETEYDDHASGPQWFRMTVMSLPRPQGGAVVTHLNITEKKLSELEQQRTQEELFQLNRVAEMGQLTASLAHELAQPLSAVLINAQAAARLAAHAEPDLLEVREALADIIEDDQRARIILNNMRSILKKHTVTPHRVNLNGIVDSVTVIVKSNAQLREIQLRSELSTEAVLVEGDEVPLQQVLLNLINNAMDAVSHLPMERRVLTLRTSLLPQKSSGVLMVEDDGPGIPDAVKDRLFLPFFTTKPDGLGMGLAICRVILQTLGGSITCQNRPGSGASFHVELPLAQ